MSPTTTRIPTGDELAERLAGIEGLLTAKQWERAAIVFAFTEVGEIGAGRWRKPQPPKMNIREFSRRGYAGLSTNKSVEHYRNAWLAAIDSGHAVPVEPGQTTRLPDLPFPAWATTTERAVRTARPTPERVFSGIDAATLAIQRMPFIQDGDLTPDVHRELRTKLLALRVQTDEALAILTARTPAPTPVASRHLSTV